jgi:hypothetical protein
MKKFVMVALLYAAPVLAIPPTPAFRDGDVVVTSAAPTCAVDPPPPPDFVTTLHRRDASASNPVTTSVITAMTYWENIRGIAVARGISASEVEIDFLGSDGHFVPIATVPNGRVTAMTPLGTDLLAVVYGSSAAPDLWRITPAGTVIDRMQLPAESNYIGSIDIAADRCTMFYTASTTTIGRFDVCARHALSPFAQQGATNVRVLSDGGVLAASATQLVRFDAAGNVVGRFPLTAEFESIGAMTLDQNPGIAWVVTTFGCSPGTAHVIQVSIGTGSVIAGPAATSRAGGLSIAVQGEWHASVNKTPSRRRAVH